MNCELKENKKKVTGNYETITQEEYMLIPLRDSNIYSRTGERFRMNSDEPKLNTLNAVLEVLSMDGENINIGLKSFWVVEKLENEE